MSPVCPQCGSADFSQAVRAIVNAQTSHSVGVTNTIGAGGFRANHGAIRGHSTFAAHSRTRTTTRSQLAGLLRLPRVKSSPAMWLVGAGLVIMGLFFFVLFYAIIVSSAPDPKSPIPHVTLAVMAGALVSAPFWLPGLILVAIGLRRRHRFKREAPVRARMAGIWHEARYCDRDDVVYLPDGTWAPPDSFRPMLRELAMPQALR